MTTDNRRNEEQSEAETKEPRESLAPLLNSAMVGKAERNKSILPDRQQATHIATIEGVVGWSNMQEALKAVVRNRGAPGIDDITTKEIEMVMWQKWPKIRQEILEG